MNCFYKCPLQLQWQDTSSLFFGRCKHFSGQVLPRMLSLKSLSLFLSLSSASPAAGAGVGSSGFAADTLALGVNKNCYFCGFPCSACQCPNVPSPLSWAFRCHAWPWHKWGPGWVKLNEKGRLPGAVGRTLDSNAGHELASYMTSNKQINLSGAQLLMCKQQTRTLLWELNEILCKISWSVPSSSKDLRNGCFLKGD